MKANVKKYMTGGELMALQSAAKVGLGGLQTLQALPELYRLKQNKPKFEIAAAVKEYAKQPVSQTYRQEAESQLRSGLSSGLAAARTGGARTLLGAAPSLYNQYSGNVRAAEAQFDQERARALGLLGQEQRTVQNLKMQDWQNQVAAASKHLSASTQNMFGGMQDYTRYKVQEEQLANMPAGYNPYMNPYMNPYGTTATPAAPESTSEFIRRIIPGYKEFEFTPIGTSTGFGQSPMAGRFNGSGFPLQYQVDPTGFGQSPMMAGRLKGGENGMVTDGKFSHESNPISLVDKAGEVVGEVTGNEVVLNPEQAKAVGNESPYFRKLLKMFKSKK